MLQKRKMIDIAPPPIIETKLQETTLEQKFLKDRPILKTFKGIQNSVNNTTNITNNNHTKNNLNQSESPFGEIKFIQNQEKISPEKQISRIANGSINDEIIENILETSKKQLINLLKKRGLNVPENVAKNNSSRKIDEKKYENKIDLLDQKISKLNATVSQLENRND